MQVSRFRLISCLFLIAASSGCYLRGEYGLTRIWCDYNTLGAPALFYEEVSDRSYDAVRMSHCRWMDVKQVGSGTVYQEGPVGEAATGISQFETGSSDPRTLDTPAGSKSPPPVPPVPLPEEFEFVPLNPDSSDVPRPLPALPIDVPAPPIEQPTADRDAQLERTSHHRANDANPNKAGNRAIHFGRTARRGKIVHPPPQSWLFSNP